MDVLIATAAHALSVGDPLAALKRVALRDDAAALAVRGIAMAQLGDLKRARELLRNAARQFGSKVPVARARCIVAEAEIALVSRDLGRSSQTLEAARAMLEASGDRTNAAHAGYLEARRLLLIGRLDEAEGLLDEVDADILPPPSLVGYELVRQVSRSGGSGPSRRAPRLVVPGVWRRVRASRRSRARWNRQCGPSRRPPRGSSHAVISGCFASATSRPCSVRKRWWRMPAATPCDRARS